MTTRVLLKSVRLERRAATFTEFYTYDAYALFERGKASWHTAVVRRGGRGTEHGTVHGEEQYPDAVDAEVAIDSSVTRLKDQGFVLAAKSGSLWLANAEVERRAQALELQELLEHDAERVAPRQAAFSRAMRAMRGDAPA